MKIGDFARKRSVWLKISGRRGLPHHPFFSENYRLNDLSYSVKNLHSSFFRFVTIHAFDRRTDRILVARPRLHSMQRGKKFMGKA